MRSKRKHNRTRRNKKGKGLDIVTVVTNLLTAFFPHTKDDSAKTANTDLSCHILK